MRAQRSVPPPVQRQVLAHALAHVLLLLLLQERPSFLPLLQGWLSLLLLLLLLQEGP